MNKVVNFLVVMSISTILSGCFSNRVFMKAEFDYSDQRVTKIHTAHLDTLNNLLVTLEITDNMGNSNSYFLKVNLDTITDNSNFDENNSTIFFNKKTKRATRISHIKKTYKIDSAMGIEVVCKKGIFSKDTLAITNNSTSIDTNKFKVNYTGIMDGIYGYPSFTYYPDGKIKIDSTEYEYFTFTLDRIKKAGSGNIYYYLLQLYLIF